MSKIARARFAFCILKALPLALLSLPLSAHAATELLQVYTYDSLKGKGSLTEAILKDFVSNQCKIDFVSVGDSLQMVGRLESEFDRGTPHADVILGFDQFQVPRLKRYLEAPPAVKGLIPQIASAVSGMPAVPFDAGFMTFMVDTNRVAKTQFATWKDDWAAIPDKSTALIDPRTSTPGWGFYLLTRQTAGSDWRKLWKQLKPKWLTLAPSWDSAYALFTSGRASWVWSYLSSQAYHQAQGELSRKAVRVDEGLPLQIELAGVVKKKRTVNQVRCVELFFSTLLSRTIQREVPKRQWMFPVLQDVDLPSAFDGVPGFSKTKVLELKVPSPDDTSSMRREWESEVRAQ